MTPPQDALYDLYCAFCKRSLAEIRAWDRRPR
jgi:predicted Fe-S protein YdhL (DUF1289 family)